YIVTLGLGLFPLLTFSVSGNFGFQSLYSLNLWNRKATIVSIFIHQLFVSWPMSHSEMSGALNFKIFFSFCPTAQLSFSLKRRDIHIYNVCLYPCILQYNFIYKIVT